MLMRKQSWMCVVDGVELRLHTRGCPFDDLEGDVVGVNQCR